MPNPTPVTQPIDITTETVADTVTALNAASHLDAYGQPWTSASITAAHDGTDENQRKRLILLLILILLAIG